MGELCPSLPCFCTHIEHDAVTDKSKCLVVETDKICSLLLKGKNSANLKVHLRSSHKAANLEYLNKLASVSSPPPPEREATSRSGGTGEETTVMDCFHRRPNSCWLVNTPEHHKREDALVNMFIEQSMKKLKLIKTKLKLSIFEI